MSPANHSEICRRLDELLAARSAGWCKSIASFCDDRRTIIFYGHTSDDDAVVLGLDLSTEVAGEFDHERYERELAEARLLFH